VIARLEEVQKVLTDDRVAAETVAALKARGIEVLVV
jgi:hypothetical protein